MPAVAPTRERERERKESDKENDSAMVKLQL